MTQTAHLLDALKQCLKSRGLTYREVGEALGLSEASIKRLFSERSFSLQRLEEVLGLLDMNLYELAKMSRLAEDAAPRELSEAQEAALAADPLLLTTFYLLMTGWTPARIRHRFELGRAEADGYLARLAALKLISRPAPNTVRLLTGRRINWRRNGPVRRLYEARVKAEFLRSRFAGADETMRLESAELTDASIKLLRRRIDRLANDFEDYAEADISAQPQDKRAYALLLAFRPWTFWSLVEDG